MEIQHWIDGKFEETKTDYKISGHNILYKNEIEFLHTMLTATQGKRVPSPGSFV